MQIIFSTSNSPSFNQASEEFLFKNTQQEYLFLYVNEPSIIIGSNQVVRNEVNIPFCNEKNICIVRRMSGGGAVYHDDGNLNFCFISNRLEGKSSLSADFLLPIVAVLNEIKMPVEIGKRKELRLDGFKISGTASHVSKNRELHHGTLLYDTDLNKLQHALTSHDKIESLKGTPSVPDTVINMRAYIQKKEGNSLPSCDFFQLLLQKFSEYFNVDISTLSPSDISSIQQIEEKYISSDWTFRK